MMTKKPSLDRNNAEEVAISALVFLSNQPEQMQRFMDLTGLDPASIRSAASDRNFLVSVLEHIMQDEAVLLSLAESASLNPADIVAACQILSGAAHE